MGPHSGCARGPPRYHPLRLGNVLDGLGVRRSQLLEASERARAEAEMDDLRRVVAEAAERGGVTHRTLSKRGYTSPKIRRWIALECGVVLPDRDA